MGMLITRHRLRGIPPEQSEADRLEEERRVDAMFAGRRAERGLPPRNAPKDAAALEADAKSKAAATTDAKAKFESERVAAEAEAKASAPKDAAALEALEEGALRKLASALKLPVSDKWQVPSIRKAVAKKLGITIAE